MKRRIFEDHHDLFRKSFAQFLDREVKPNQERWLEAGQVDRDVWTKAGASGFLCPWVGEEFGGPGGDFLHACIVIEELSKAYESGFMMSLHSDVVAPYVDEFGTEAFKKEWLPKFVSGEAVSAIAMTEPNTGSDLAAIRTTARLDGDHYVINGSKTFISNGQICDVMVLAAKTGDNPDNPHGNISLFLVEADSPGFSRGRRLKKVGLASQDTSEMHFEDVRVPVSHRLGEEGQGFTMMMRKLQQERLVLAVSAQAAAEQVLKDTITYVKERKAFGKPISKFQNTQFKLAECATQIEVGRHFLDQLLVRHMAGEYLVKECSMAKLFQSEMVWKVADECVQLHGGYGYMLEYPVARAFVDARIGRIYAGTNEVMKIIIAKQMGL